MLEPCHCLAGCIIVDGLSQMAYYACLVYACPPLCILLLYQRLYLFFYAHLRPPGWAIMPTQCIYKGCTNTDRSDMVSVPLAEKRSRWNDTDGKQLSLEDVSRWRVAIIRASGYSGNMVNEEEESLQLRICREHFPRDAINSKKKLLSTVPHPLQAAVTPRRSSAPTR